MQPVINVTVPYVPAPSIDQMDLVFHRGAEVHKPATETIIPTGTKYTDKQLVHLLAFCGLRSTERNVVPDIWTNLQTTKD